MHVLLIPSWYKTPANPSLGSFFEEQARMMIRRGCQIGVLYPKINLTFSSRWKSREKVPAHTDDDFLPVYYSFSKSLVPRSRRINFWYLAYKAEKAFKGYVKSHGVPDILHAHAVFYGGIVAAHLSRKFNIPYLLTEHFTGLVLDDIPDIPASYSQVRKVFSLSSANLAVSSDFKERLVRLYHLQKNSIEVLHNVVNPIFFSLVPAPSRSPFVFIVNGFLTEKKNHRLLFSAFKMVSEKFDSRLHVIGDGPLRNELEDVIVQLGIAGRVTFFGNIGRQEVKHEIDRSHALVSSSIFETFGISIAEALASGRPVVVTDSGGPGDFIRPYNGIVSLTSTPEALAQAMIGMIQSYDTFDQSYISRMCSQAFSEDVIGLRLESIYQKIFSDRR